MGQAISDGGFIGALLSQTGYEVVFVDVNDDVVNTINRDKTYPQEIVGEKRKNCLDRKHTGR